jgi:hypothetical protein
MAKQKFGGSEPERGEGLLRTSLPAMPDYRTFAFGYPDGFL